MTITIDRLAPSLLALPRQAKRIIVLSVDFSLCILSVWLAYYLRLGEFVAFSDKVFWPMFVSVVIALPIFVVSGFYRAIFRYSGWPVLLAISRTLCIYALLYAAIFTAVGIPGIPRTIGIIQPILLLLFVGSSRTLVHVWLGPQYKDILKHAARPKVLIYGAGQSGRQLAAALANSHEMQVSGFVDDDDRLHGHVLNRHAIYAPNDLPELVPTLGINAILLAMPGISRARRNEILGHISNVRVAVRTLPKLSDLAQGKFSPSELGELDIDDLLGRDCVTPNHLLLTKNNTAKVVLVTGAGGSIGSELCRQILATNPDKLLLIEQSEYALYAIHQELLEKVAERTIAIIPLLASVQNYDRMHEIMRTWHPQTVYHAAAYKHVPLVEHNPAEGIRNNVFGTLQTARAAADNEVENFVLISTDKAVRPTNIMGSSKRVAEMVLQALADKRPATNFAMVRFGNVLGSSGSVVPKFRKQIRDGGPISLTHPDVTRYFMTIPEAAQLVIQAGAMSRGGDVFVLDMGQPVRIIDLARRMITLSGLTVRDEANPDGDIAIETIGLRPGEKLYEELLIGDNPKPTSHPRIMKAHEACMQWSVLEPKLRALDALLAGNDVQAIRTMMSKLVTGYAPIGDIVDWVHLESEAMRASQ